MDAIVFKNVYKHFNIYTNKVSSIKEHFVNKILNRNKLNIRKFTVLDNVSFTIKKGETVGIIGENGTGKSTSLKIVSKILTPNKGQVFVNGTVSSLLEVGAGFQPELTGRENVYLYGTILGLNKKIIDKRYEDIVKFAELEEFMDNPVKNYSSGMYMRLAFAVAINVDPDILVIDEVLAVGDENFQKKCFQKIDEFREKGKTILFVSHDMSIIKRICDRVIFIERGGKVKIGDKEELINEYLTKVYVAQSAQDESETNDESVNDTNQKNRWGNRKVEIKKVTLYKDEEPANVFNHNDDIVIKVDFTAKEKVDRAVLGIAINNEEGVLLAGPNSKEYQVILTNLNGDDTAKLIINKNPFLMGKYYLTVAIYDFSCQIPFDHMEKHFSFQILNGNVNQTGLVKLDCKWIFNGGNHGSR